MEERPHTKPPKEYTGQGWEIIGSPSDSRDHFSIHFRDGVFDMIEFPRTILMEPHPEDPSAMQSHKLRSAVERLALHIRENPEDVQAKRSLRAIAKNRTTQRAIKSIKEGSPLSTWPIQNDRDRAAFLAVMTLAEKHNRPPSGDEVIDFMIEGAVRPKHWKTNDPLILDDDRGNAKKLLVKVGFAWLEFRKRGFHRDC